MNEENTRIFNDNFKIVKAAIRKVALRVNLNSIVIIAILVHLTFDGWW